MILSFFYSLLGPTNSKKKHVLHYQIFFVSIYCHKFYIFVIYVCFVKVKTIV